MAEVREVASLHPQHGVYILAATSGAVRALVDPNLTQAMPRLRHGVQVIGRILQRCVADQGLAVSVRFEPVAYTTMPRGAGV